VEPGSGEPSVPVGQVRVAGLRAGLEKAESSLGSEAPASARLDLYREFLRLEESRLEEQARGGTAGLELAHRRAQLITAVLERLWENSGGPAAGDGLVLGAVGGFGRQEMSPASDIDLVFFREGATDRTAEEVVKQILYVLWDLGLKVGHACRTVAETVERAEAELMIKTALLDARRLTGSQALWRKFEEEFSKRNLGRGVESYLSWRLENQAARHAKEGGTVFVQEPNLKTGVGGLRDFHNLRWVGKVSGEGATLADLVRRGWLGSEEAVQAETAFGFLMTLREQLHIAQSGPGDVLTLRLQGELATAMGYPQPNILRKSEALMRETYGHLRTIHLVCNAAATRICQQKTGRPRGLWSFFSGWSGARRAVDGFVLSGAELGAESPEVFRQDPVRMIRVFRILQDQGSVPGAELSTLLRANFSLLTEKWARRAEVRETFLHILRQKGKVGRILRYMHECGVLGRILPEFAPLTCLVQHEFFHRYTADEHTLVCLEQLDAMLDSKEPDLRKYGELYRRVETPEILVLAVLLHDTGKAELTRNHEEIGAVHAAQVARRFGFRGRELALMTFLVDHHMTLGNFSRKNLDEAETIRSFARIVQDEERLNLLMLISAADVRAVAGRNNWSSWRELLVWDLYARTKRMLAGEEEFLRAEEEERRGRVAQVEAELAGEFSPEVVTDHLAGMGPAYVRQCPAALIARHLRAVHRFFADRVGGAEALVPLVEWLDRPDEGHTEVIVITWDRERLFSKIAGSFAVAECNILSADVFTRADNVVFDTFRVCNARMEPVSHRVDRETFEKTLTESLCRTEDSLGEKLSGQGPTMWQKAIGEAEFPASLRIDTESEPGRTLLHVQAPDRVGLLHALTGGISDEGMLIGVARITTEKGAALDSFSLVDREHRAVTDAAWQERLLQRLKEVLSR
jgi:[protein-PII] uridylyltransferase